MLECGFLHGDVRQVQSACIQRRCNDYFWTNNTNIPNEKDIIHTCSRKTINHARINV